MRSSGWQTKAGLAALAVAAFFALTWVAQISSGTGYPRYSSLSSAPSGSKLLFEVLQRSGRFASVERNYLPPEQFHPLHSTVFYLGLGNANDSLLKYYEQMAQSGNRIVLGVKTEFSRTGGWSELGGSGVWERQFGAGAMLVVTHAGRLSNKELAQRDSARALVPLLVSDAHSIWFEEGHLGVIESGSIAGLMRRYRMGGALAGCLLLTALLLWRNAVRFPPAAEGEKDSETVVVGTDGHGMMTEMLGRHVPSSQLMDVCVAEWNRLERRRILNAAAWRGRGPVAAYRDIAAELGPKRVRKT